MTPEAGRRTMKVLPRPSSLSTKTSPPMRLVKRRQMAANCSDAMPGPVSLR